MHPVQAGRRHQQVRRGWEHAHAHACVCVCVCMCACAMAKPQDALGQPLWLCGSAQTD